MARDTGQQNAGVIAAEYPNKHDNLADKPVGTVSATGSAMNAIDHINMGETQMLFRANVHHDTVSSTIGRIVTAPSRLMRAMTDPFRRVIESFDASVNLQNDEY